jgi:hypothetical protein
VVRSLLFTFLLGVATLSSAVAGPEPWTSQRDPQLGFRFSYPEAMFSRLEGERPSFNYFASADSTAKFLVGGFHNRKGDTPDGFKRWMMANAEGYDEITYRPRGRSWFVLSGYRGDQIYYEKVMFSCGGRVVNVFAISYPTARRALYNPVVERMEDNFHPGRNCL